MESALEQITLAELMQLAITDKLIDLHVSMPARVESYDASKQTVDVVPQLNRSLPDGAGGWVTEQLPKLSDVPVAFPRGGGFFVSFPIAAGDYVLLVFSERNIGNWRATGNQGDPGDLGLHPLDGAVAIPGVYPSTQPLATADATDMVIGHDSGTGAIRISPTGVISLGSSATEQGVLGDTQRTQMAALNTAVNTALAIIITALTNAGAALTTASGQSSFNAVVQANLGTAGGALTGAAGSVTAIETAITNYETAAPGQLSNVVKLL